MNTFLTRHFPLFLFVFLIIQGCWSSRNAVNNDGISYKKLSWSDFKGKVDPGLKYYAMTYWSVFYNYDEPVFKGDQAEVTVRVRYDLKETSWYKPDKVSDTLLNHEQGHLNIAYLLALDLQQTFRSHRYTKDNYKHEIDSIYSTLEKKYLEMELLYDKETDHMYNQAGQQRWDSYFRERIKYFTKD